MVVGLSNLHSHIFHSIHTHTYTLSPYTPAHPTTHTHMHIYHLSRTHTFPHKVRISFFVHLKSAEVGMGEKFTGEIFPALGNPQS